MKRLIIVSGIFLLLGILSCDKKDITPPGQFPEWLQLKITELIPNQNLCEITDVTIIEYNGKRYYDVYCAIWSCLYCHLFDEQGNRPNWDSNAWNDFFAKKKDVEKVPACK